jgi:hypothetical protein
MPSKSASGKNEKQYEKLKKKGHVEVPGGSHCQQPWCLEPQRKEIGIRIQL